MARYWYMDDTDVAAMNRGRANRRRASRGRVRRFVRYLFAAVVVLASSSCVPPPGVGCHSEVDRLWPPAARARAHKVVQRESHGIASAQNRRSTAAGCFQMLVSHAPRYRRLGYTWADRYNATANVRVALDLWHDQGWTPWRLTA